MVPYCALLPIVLCFLLTTIYRTYFLYRYTFFTYSYLHLYTGLLNVLVLIVYLKAWNFIT